MSLREPVVLRASAEERPGLPESAAGWLAGPWSESDPHVRHSRLVLLLRRVLPAIGAALLLLIAVWPRLAPVWERMRLAFPAIDLRDARELDMINPHYSGIDREGRPFAVTAASGRQLPDRQDLVSLQGPRADLKGHNGANIVVTARTGVYQSQTQLLDLFGDVTLVHQNGMRFVTEAARVNAASNTAEGQKPVQGHGPSGDVKAEGFRIADRGDKILFTGRSDLVLRGAHAAAGPAAPAASAASPIAAAAKPQVASAAPRPVRAVPATLREASHRGVRHPVHRAVRRVPAHGQHADGKPG